MSYTTIYINTKTMEEFIKKLNDKYKDYRLVFANRVLVDGITVAIEGILQKETKEG